MRYLLGDLSEDEKTRMEEAYFADDAKFEELELAEEELIDAYVRQELSPEEEEQFKARLMQSPRLVERVNFAQALAEKADSTLPDADFVERDFVEQDLVERDLVEPPIFVSPATQPTPGWWARLFSKPAFQAAFATSVVLLLVGGVTLSYSWLQLRRESERLASERTELQRQKDELQKRSTEQQGSIEQLTADLQRAREQQTQDQPQIKQAQDQPQIKPAQDQQQITQAQDQQRSKPELPSKPKERAQPLFAAVSSLVLTPGSLRSGGSDQVLKIGPNTSVAELKLQLEENDYRRYRVIVENVDDGKIVFDRSLSAQKISSGLQQTSPQQTSPQQTSSGSQKTSSGPQKTRPGGQLILRIPVQRLTTGDYIIKVSARSASGSHEPVSDYKFRVTRE